MIRPRTAIHRGWILVSSCALILFCSGGVPAQPTSEDDPAEPERAAALREVESSMVREVKARAFLLKDKDGELVPFFNIPLEDFIDMLDRHQSGLQRNLPPTYGLEQIEIHGVAGRDHVLLDIVVHVIIQDENWVRIPLRLNEGHLRKPVEVDEGMEARMVVDPESEGHVCFVQGKPGQKATLRLQMAYRTEQVGSETRLSFNIARSSLVTKLSLIVPDRRVVTTVSDEATIQAVDALADGGTRIDVVDIEGQLRMAWREELAEPQPESSLLEAKGKILVSVVGRGNIHSTAWLQLRSYGKPVTKVRVELPPGAQWLPPPSQPNGYTVEIVSDDQQALAPDKRQAVDIKFERPDTSPPEIQLTTNRVLEAGIQDELTDVAGYRVLGAFRQSGHIALAAGAEGYPRWNEEQSVAVSRINSLPESLQKESVLAGFEYFRQPCSLMVEILLRESKVTIEPFHTLTVESERLRLESRLNVTVRGAKAAFLNVDMQGWVVEDVEDVEPEELVDKTALVLEETSPLGIHLTQPSTGNFQLVIRASRELPVGGEQSFEVTLPRARSHALRAARLAVVPDDNIALTPRSQLKGLSADAASSFPIELHERQQEPFFYRETTTLLPTVFAADFVVRKSSLATTLHSNVTIRDEFVRVHQRFEYDVRHEPVEQLPLLLPASLPEEVTVSYRVEGELIDSIGTANRTNGNRPGPRAGNSDGETEAGDQAPRRVLVPLRRPRSGNVVLTVDFEIPSRILSPSNLGTLSIPLALPTGGNTVTAKHTLEVTSEPPLTAAVEDPAWIRREAISANSHDQRMGHWTNSGESSSVEVTVSRPTLEEGETTVVDLAWVQTWLSGDKRQDRAAFRLTTANSSLPLRLPNGALSGHADILVDGQKANVISTDRSTVTIDLGTQNGADVQHLVEVWYELIARRPADGNLQVEPPGVAGQSWTRQSYWQLILPRDECLLANPTSLMPEFNWAWSNLLMRPSANVTARMEQQLATYSRQPAPSLQGTHQYLFSTLSDLPVIQARIASQKAILLIVAGTILVLGGLLIYVPALRHPIVLLLLSVAILVFGQRFPETSVLIGQAAALGIALVVVQRVGHGLLVWRKRHKGVVHGTTGSSIERLPPGTDQLPSGREESRVISTVTATNPSSVSHSRL